MRVDRLSLKDIGKTVKLRLPRFDAPTENLGTLMMQGPFRELEGALTGLRGISIAIDDTRLCSEDRELIFPLDRVLLEIDKREEVALPPSYEVHVRETHPRFIQSREDLVERDYQDAVVRANSGGGLFLVTGNKYCDLYSALASPSERENNTYNVISLGEQAYPLELLV